MKKLKIISLAIVILLLSNITVLADVDQKQDKDCSSFGIFGERMGAQSFIPTKSILTRLDIILEKTGNITSELFIAISNEKTGDSSKYYFVVSLTPIEVDFYDTWVEIDCPDISLNPGETYYIIVYSTGGTENDNYEWHLGSYTNYENGKAYCSYDQGNNWDTKDILDFCFKTYGYNPPEIEKKVLKPDTNENNENNWVDEVSVLGWEEKLKFRIRVKNNDEDEYIHLSVDDDLPNFLTYHSGNSSIQPTEESSKYLKWSISGIEPSGTWEVKYSTFVENQGAVGFNSASAYLIDPPCSNKKVKDEKGIINKIIDKIYTRISKNEKLFSFVNKIIDFFNLRIKKVVNQNNFQFLSNQDLDISDNVKITVIKNNPKVDCKGEIYIDEMRIGDVIDENDGIFFNVRNNGQENSKLDYEMSYPFWTSKYSIEVNSFSYQGRYLDLKPNEGWVKIFIFFCLEDVEKINERYEGYVIIRNKQNHDDYDNVPIIINKVKKKPTEKTKSNII